TYVGYIGAEATKILPYDQYGHTRILVPMEGTGTPPNVDQSSDGSVNQFYDVDATGNPWSAAADRGTTAPPDNPTATEPAQAGEECWVLLPDGSILTTDSSFQWQYRSARRYFPNSNSWARTDNLPVELRDGPAVLVPGTKASPTVEKAWYTGYTQNAQGAYLFHTAYYNVNDGTWAAQTPDLPSGILA